MTEREALKLLVEVFGGGDWHEEIVDSAWADKANKAIASAKEVLAQPEQEPVGEVSKAEFGDYPVICWRKGYVAKIGDKFYTTPPQRTWVGLTEAEIEKLAHYHGIDSLYEPGVKDFYEAIADKLKEKNT